MEGTVTMTTEATPAPQNVTIELVFMGAREIAKGKIGHAFIPLALVRDAKSYNECEQQSSIFVFKRKDLPRVVGGVYTAQGQYGEGGRIQRLAPSFKLSPDVLPINPDFASAMVAADTATQVADRARKTEVDMKENNTFAKALAPLRQAYQKTDSIGRLALEVVVLAEMRRNRF